MGSLQVPPGKDVDDAPPPGDGSRPPHQKRTLTSNAAVPDTGTPALRETELLTNMDDTSFAALGAYQFPSVASLRTSFSSVRSATARRRRVFSRSSSFRRRAWSTFRPPYLPTPTIVTLFRYSDMPAYLANRLALRQENLCFTEVTNDPLD